MSINQGEIWAELRTICEEALQALAQQVTTVWPQFHFQSGDSSNPAFPLGLWGSFTHKQMENREGVDVSIDFRWDKDVVEVIADVAYESGQILSESPAQYIPLREDGGIAADTAYEVARRISKYVRAQWELIGTALCKE